MSTKPIILLPNSARCFSLGAAIIALLIFSFTALPTAKAQSNRFEAGVAAKERGQYLTAIRSWLPLAEDGMADAQVNLGHMYNEGFGVDRDLSTALYWYERAAESGLGEAKYNLGLLYFYGDGVPKDLVTAITLFREAEEQNIQEASYMLGVAALSGDGVPIDKTEARERFERAALAGIPEAQLAYASVAQSGEGGEPVSSGFFGLFGSNKPPEGRPVVAYVWARLAQINGLTAPELTQVLEVAEIMLTTPKEEAEGIITTCLASELSNCPTAD
jgi:uncharacterized protein